MVAVSTSWPRPDQRPVASAPPAFAAADVQPARPALAVDVYAGLLTAAVTVLVGAPIGLLWAAFAPRVDVVRQGENVQLVEPGTSGFIAADGAFLLAVAIAGAVGGVVCWLLAREHGPAVVVGLTVGGILAAYVAMNVGVQVGLQEVEAFGAAGGQGVFGLPPTKLRLREALVGWPVGALLAYVGATLLRGR
jgi:hypothetical protein